MRHGLYVYSRGWCRCDVCRAANAAYQRAWRRHGGVTVEAWMARGVAAALVDLGADPVWIARHAGVSTTTVRNLLAGRSRTVQRRTYQQLRRLAEQVGERQVMPPGWDAAARRRRQRQRKRQERQRRKETAA